MSKKTKQKGAAKAYATQQRQQDREDNMKKRKAGARSYARTSAPTPQRVLTVRLAGIALMVAAIVGALALAIPYGGNYPTGVILSLAALGIVTGLGLYAAIRSREVAQRIDSVRSNAARKR